MARIVAGFVMPHDPLIFVNPKGLDRSKVLAAYEHIRVRLRELEVTTAIVIGADHYILFGPNCLPQM